MKRFELIILALILIGGFLVRLYHFTYPVADWHSWRQVDTSAVSRNFVKDGFDLLHPKFDDLSNVPSGVFDNPQGYRFVEFPIYNVLQAKAFLVFGRLTLEEWGRMVSIISSLVSTFLLYVLVSRYSNRTIGLFAAFFFSFLPFNVYWSRTILPDSTATTATLAGLLFFDLWIKNLQKNNYRKILYFLLSGIFLAMSLLIKPFAGFFFLPIVWSSWQKWRISMFKRADLIALAVISLVPWLLWRWWSLQFPPGVPQSGWLFNEGNIRFKGSFFHWIFASRIADLILGFWGVAIFAVGVATKNKPYFLSFLFSSLLYIFIVAKGNVQHSYYQIPIVATIAIFLALGSNFFINPPRQYFSKLASILVFAVCVSFMFVFSWFEVRDYYNIQDPAIIAAGNAVDKLAPKDAKIIAPYEGDTTLLYFTKRQGWPSFEKDINVLIKMGADYLVLSNPKKADYDIGNKYKIVASSPQYLIFDLHQKP